MTTSINEAHIENLQAIDRILSRIYNDGSNSATFEHIFNSEEGVLSGVTPSAVYFLNRHDKQLECLAYLENEGLLRRTHAGSYHLTFKGILKASGDTFESNYRDEVAFRFLVEATNKSTVLRNHLSLALSAIAILLSIYVLSQ